jgi:hypothetical protein
MHWYGESRLLASRSSPVVHLLVQTWFSDSPEAKLAETLDRRHQVHRLLHSLSMGACNNNNESDDIASASPDN